MANLCAESLRMTVRLRHIRFRWQHPYLARKASVSISGCFRYLELANFGRPQPLPTLWCSVWQGGCKYCIMDALLAVVAKLPSLLDEIQPEEKNKLLGGGGVIFKGWKFLDLIFVLLWLLGTVLQQKSHARRL